MGAPDRLGRNTPLLSSPLCGLSNLRVAGLGKLSIANQLQRSWGRAPLSFLLLKKVEKGKSFPGQEDRRPSTKRTSFLEPRAERFFAEPPLPRKNLRSDTARKKP